MPLSLGSRLGPYEILSPLGAGGMGEVYRARDSRLGRDVAIKALPEEWHADPERLRRFEQEAKAAGALNHPNLLAVYDVGTHDGSPYIVSELLEGETLRERLRAGELTLRKALETAIGTARGLSAVHAKGIVHRDLKPANVFVMTYGHVKILDFGLAKLVRREEAESDGETASQLTSAGSAVGTAGYMSPEQVRGQAPDHRSDIFSLGVVLHEMVSGRRPFRGEINAEVMTAILREDPPDLGESGAKAPGLARIVRRCLEKRPEERFHSAHDLALALEAVGSSSEGSDHASPAQALHAQSASGSRRAVGALIGLLALALAAMAGWLVGRARPPRGQTRLQIVVDSDQMETAFATFPLLSLSQDGSVLVYGERGQLVARRIDSFATTLLPGTEGATMPALSPDGKWLAFAEFGKPLRKAPVTGGPSVNIATTETGAGRTWGEDGQIYYAAGLGSGGIWRVSADGGEPQPVTKVDERAMENAHAWPQLLPGARDILFTALGASGGAADSRIVVETLGAGSRTTLVDKATYGRYVPTGHLLYAKEDGTIFAVPFNPAKREVKGTAVPVLSGVRVAAWGGSALLDVATDGTLVYMPATGSSALTLKLLDRSGRELRSVDVAGTNGGQVFSPDGGRLAFNVREPSKNDIWLFDITSGDVERFTLDVAEDEFPVWSPDGRTIAYTSAWTGETRRIFTKSVESGTSPKLVRTWPHHVHVSSWSPDGKWLAAWEINPATGWDIWAISLDGSEPVRVATSAASEAWPAFSPDGKWLSYTTDESGRSEVYVTSFPALTAKRQISTSGGYCPRWDASGRTLYYVAEDDRLIAVPVSAAGAFKWGTPQPLFKLAEARLRGFDVSPDGQRFAFVVRGNETPPPIHVVLNWFEELKRRVPVE